MGSVTTILIGILHLELLPHFLYNHYTSCIVFVSKAIHIISGQY